MSTRKKSNNFVQRLFKPTWRFFDVAIKALVNRLLRSLLVLKRQSRLSRAGFVLPTVVMVILVVTLLTTAIMIRSFDRSKNASNVRVDQAVLNAARPAIDRARAKIDKLFSPEEADLQGNTPPEANIAQVLEQPKYKLGDETQIQITGDFGGQTPADSTARTLRSAWKFPVDTDNNGRFDTFTLYGIYFRNPRATENRPRGTTEARALPQNDGVGERCANGAAGGVEGWTLIGGQLKKAFFTYVANVPITDLGTLPPGTDATQYEQYRGNKGFSALEMQLDQARIALDNNAIWYNDDLSINNIPSLRLNGRVHTNSNLLVSNADANPIKFLQVSSLESCFYNPANAKIIVGGNVAAGDIGQSDSGSNAVTADLYQGKGNNPRTEVINAGNKTTTLSPSDVAGNSDAYTQRLNVLVQGAIAIHDQANPNNASPDTNSVAAMSGRYPPEVIEAFNKKFDSSNQGGGLSALTQSLETYFANRIRRVSFAEVPVDAPAGTATNNLSAAPGAGFVFSGGGVISAPQEWMLIEDASGNPGNYTRVPLNFSGGGLQMPATDPGTGTSAAAASTRPEQLIGDRVQVGNNLPNTWLKPDNTFAAEGETQPVVNGGSPVNWNNSGNQRKRAGLAEQLDDLGDTSRNGYWETAAAKLPPLDTEDLAGGLRVVTGAGIYVDGANAGPIGTGKRISDPAPNPGPRSFLPEPTLDSYYATAIDPATKAIDPTKKAALDAALPPNPIVVWPDSMPMYQWKDRTNPTVRKPFPSLTNPEQFKGDLQMRATVVYHYKTGEDPIACISSYYDPTDTYTARDIQDPQGGMSDNGFSYTPPTAGQRVASPRLNKQARMVFPDGRWVNKPLYDALDNLRRGNPLSLADKAAFDAANCAISILDGSATRTTSPVPDGAIKEAAFLDARQVKALHKIGTESLDNTTAVAPATLINDLNNPDHLKVAPLGALTSTDYTLPIEQRQPLEVRVTEIDLGALKAVPIGAGGGSGATNVQDYLLPNSGIIYATRDDALPDLSASQTPASNLAPEVRNKKNTPSETAATDFKLDPTRRPNGIRLINGSSLERVATYRAAEKGLILASDLPVYVKGDFNVHKPSGSSPTSTTTLEEFQEQVDNTGTNFYTRSTPDTRFACRDGAPTGCGSPGDQWRGARILSDAITLLSNNFRDGYRYEGDYDLRNNAGNQAVEAYLDNGFWANSFATTAQWYDSGTGLPKTTFEVQDGKQVGSSYVMNSVTPIQRRVPFPEYRMEICTKLPASECGAQDWAGGNLRPAWLQSDTRARIAWNKAGQLAGTTATPPTTTAPADQYVSEHYARRVAFQRDAATGLLTLDQDPANPQRVTARPLPPTGQGLRYTAGATPPAVKDNALWFAVTNDPTNPSPTTGPSYDANSMLYYAPDELEAGTPTQPVHERQLLLPGTPSFPVELQALNPAFKGQTNQTVLNGLTTNDPSDYAVCNRDANSILYKTGTTGANSLTAGSCPGFGFSIRMRQALSQLSTTTPIPNVLSVDNTLSLTPDPNTGAVPPAVATATAKVNVFNLTLPPAPRTPGVIGFNRLLSGSLTLDGSNQSDPIFILISNTGLGMRFDGLQLVLKGVDPNNIFWVPRAGGVRIANAIGSNTNLVGNFIGTGPLLIDDGGQIKGGRFLGFNATTLSAGQLTALTTTAEPLLVPVVQLHSPTGRPGSANNEPLNQNWLQTAAPTTFNAVFVMGDSPSRPIPGRPAESNGGLGNFPRFLEAWGETVTTGLKAAKISGGLFQFKRSGVATAPFQAINTGSTDIALFFDGTGFPPALTTFGSDFNYRGGGSGQRAPYYMPPDRQWGYDVGLLSQTPDLFSRRFVAPQASTPNEFFREVSRDDNWVRTLMCGNTVDPATGNATTSALPPGVRPTNCPT